MSDDKKHHVPFPEEDNGAPKTAEQSTSYTMVDPRFREMAPGVVLLSHCIRTAIERGDVEFDFLRGQERYKYDLGAHDRGVYRVRLDSTSNSSASAGGQSTSIR